MLVRRALHGSLCLRPFARALPFSRPRVPAPASRPPRPGLVSCLLVSPQPPLLLSPFRLGALLSLSCGGPHALLPSLLERLPLVQVSPEPFAVGGDVELCGKNTSELCVRQLSARNEKRVTSGKGLSALFLLALPARAQIAPKGYRSAQTPG